MIVDSHIHFVDPSRPEGIVWPDPGTPHYRRAMPGDLADTAAGLQGCIAVETSRRPIDDEWLGSLALEHPMVLGIVLNLQPDLSDFATRLQKTVAHPKFVGIRLRPIDAYDLQDNSLLANIRLLEAHKKTIEFGAATPQLKSDFRRLAHQFRGATWVLDHSGHPPEVGGIDPEWQDGIRSIAVQPNTVCKLTGDYLFAPQWAAVRDELRHAFGPGRLLFGSNWPVAGFPHPDSGAIDVIKAEFGTDAAGVLGQNALHAYRIPGTSGAVSG